MAVDDISCPPDEEYEMRRAAKVLFGIKPDHRQLRSSVDIPRLLDSYIDDLDGDDYLWKIIKIVGEPACLCGLTECRSAICESTISTSLIRQFEDPLLDYLPQRGE